MYSAKFIPSTGSHRQSSVVSLWGEDWTSKLLAAIGISLYGAALKRGASVRGSCSFSQSSLDDNCLSLQEKYGNRFVSGLDASKLPKQSLRFPGELQKTPGIWRRPDGTQFLPFMVNC
ncbi:hypothetical protein TNCV_668251 [Trichonephila clavipes]|nr:hypothetical protein TNCV_668251 [Trichonephila clavipes]